MYRRINQFTVAVLAIFFSYAGFGQSAQWSFRTHQQMWEANDLFAKQKYDLAAGLFEGILENEKHLKAQYIANMKLAEISVYRSNLQAAASYYQSALEIHQPDEDEKLLEIAEVFLASGLLDEAKESFASLASDNPDDHRLAARLNGLENRDRFFDNAAQYSVESLSINSAHSDFGPVLYKDGLVFLSGRSKAMLKKKDRRTNSAFLEFYYSSLSSDGDLSAPEKLMKRGKARYNDGPLTAGVRPNTLIITRNVLKSSNDKGEKVYVLQLLEIEEKSEGKWSKPRPLPVNDGEHSFGHPSLSADGKTLYFVSDMPGGYGGTDIYSATWEDGEWSTPVNMGAKINSKGDEMFPHIYEGVLYFSSNGHPGLGGLDIYSADLTSGYEVNNLGHPVNSSSDDFSLAMVDDEMGYFASNRDGGVGDDDIYRLHINTAADNMTPMADLQVELPDLPEPEAQEVARLPPPEVTKDLLADELVGFTVQVLAMKKPEDIQSKYFRGIRDVVFYDGKDGFRRYTTGIYPTFAQALVAMKEIRDIGIDDAFVRGLKRYEELSIKKLPVAFEALEE